MNGLTPDEQKELAELEKWDAQQPPVVSDSLAPEEQEELAALEQEFAAPKMGAGQAGMEGFKQAGSLGWGDELGGVIDGVLSKTGNLFVPEGAQNPYADQSFEQSYISGRDDERAKATKAYEDQPMAALAGGLAGGATTAGVGSLASRIALGGISGTGAATEVGTSEGIVDQFIGAGIPAVVGGMGAGLRNATKAMRAVAPAAPGIAAAASAAHGNFMGAGLALAGRSGVERTIKGAANSIDSLLAKAPPQFKKALSAAAAQGSRQLAITHFMLSNQHPEYSAAAKEEPKVEGLKEVNEWDGHYKMPTPYHLSK